MTDVFISYSRHDQAIAAKLAEALKQYGWSVWWDLQLRSGQVYDKTIERALDASRCVIVLWSKQSVESDWVRAEAAFAKDHDKLLPVIIEAGIAQPIQFRHVHALQLLALNEGQTMGQFDSLFSDIENLIGQPEITTVSEQSEINESTGQVVLSADGPPPPAVGSSVSQGKTEENFLSTPKVKPGVWKRLGLLVSALIVTNAISQHGLMSQDADLVPGLRLQYPDIYSTMSIVTIASVLGAPLAAWIAGKISRRAMLIMLLLLVSAPHLLATWATEPVMRVMLAVSSAGSVMLLVLAVLLIKEEGATESLGKRIAAVVPAVLLPFPVIQLLPGLIFSAIGITVFSVIGLVLALLIWKSNWPEPINADKRSESRVLVAIWSKQTWPLYLSVTLVAAAFSGVSSLFVFHQIQSDNTYAAYEGLRLLGMILSVLGAVIAGILVDKGRSHGIALISVGLIGITAWPVFHATPIIASTAFVIAMTAAMAWKTMAYLYACDCGNPEARPWVIALTITGGSLGSVIGGAAGYAVYEQFQGTGVAILAGWAFLTMPLVRGMHLRKSQTT